jgi:hypothetical protein
MEDSLVLLKVALSIAAGPNKYFDGYQQNILNGNRLSHHRIWSGQGALLTPSPTEGRIDDKCRKLTVCY